MGRCVARVWRSEESLITVLSFHHVGLEDKTQVVSFGSRDLYFQASLPALFVFVISEITKFYMIILFLNGFKVFQTCLGNIVPLQGYNFFMLL